MARMYDNETKGEMAEAQKVALDAAAQYLGAKERAEHLRQEASSADTHARNLLTAAQKAMDAYVEVCRKAGITTTAEHEAERRKREVERV